MKKSILFVGETSTLVKYGSKEELLDLFRMMPRQERGAFNLGSLFGNKGGSVNAMAGGYGSSVLIPSGDSTPVVYNTAAGVYGAAQVAAGVDARIWEMTVPARTMISWGSGPAGVINNQGYLSFLLMKAGTGFHLGLVRLIVESADRNRKNTIDSFNDSVGQTHLSDSTSLATARPTNNQTAMRALPAHTEVIAGWASRLAINYQVVTAQAGLDTADFVIPIVKKTW